MKIKKIKQISKILVIAAIAVLLLLAIVVFSINCFLKSGQFKKIVTGRIENTLDLPVEMGNFSVNILSGVQIDNFNIKNSADFPEGYSVKTESIVLKYNLLSLLQKNFNINEIQILHPDINLLQKADGTLNLPLVSQEDGPSTTEKKAIPLLANSVQIIGANLTYTNLANNKTFSIKNLTLKAKIHSMNSFPNMNFSLSVEGIESSIIPIIEDIKGGVKTSKGMAYIDNFSFHTSGGSVEVKGDIGLPLIEKQMGLAEKPRDIKNTDYTATISVKDINLQELLNQFAPEMHPLLKGILSADITVKGQGSDAEANIKVTMPSLMVQDRIRIDKINSNIRYTIPDFAIDDLSMNIFGGSVEGKGAGNLKDIKNPFFNVNFDVNNIDAGTALTALIQDSSLAQGKLEGNLNASGTVSNIKANGKIYSKKLNVKKLGNLTDINAPFKATITNQTQQIELDGFTAKLYGGSINGKANMTLNYNREPDFSTTLNLSKIEAKNVLKELTGKKFLTGRADGNIKLSGRVNNINALKGSMELTFRDGKIVSHPIQNLMALVLQLPSISSIDFVSAQFSSTIGDGKINVQKAYVEDPRSIKFNSKGTIKLSNQKLSLPSRLSLICKEAKRMPLLSGAFTKEDNKWCGIDFKISGTLSKPKEDLQEKLKTQAIIGIFEQIIDKNK